MLIEEVYNPSLRVGASEESTSVNLRFLEAARIGCPKVSRTTKPAAAWREGRTEPSKLSLWIWRRMRDWSRIRTKIILYKNSWFMDYLSSHRECFGNDFGEEIGGGLINGVKPGDGVVKYTKAGCNKCTYVSLNQNRTPYQMMKHKSRSIQFTNYNG